MRPRENFPDDLTWETWPQHYRDAYWWWRRKLERAGTINSKMSWSEISHLFLTHMAARRLTGEPK